jgi:SAM-dependent methyltransferase
MKERRCLMEEMSVKTQMAKIRGFEKGFMATHLINIGDKVGIFEALNQAKEGLTVPEIASKLSLHEPYLKTWCQTMYHFEVLDCDEHRRFRLQPFLDEIIGDKGSVKNYLGNISLDVDLVGKGMSDAAECFRTGNAIKAYDSPEGCKLAYGTTKNIFLAFFFMILPKNEHLKQQMEKGINFLDIGCGDGTLITRLAQSFPNSRFVGVCPDIYGIKAAEASISQLGLGDRVSVMHKGGEDIEYRDEFDMINMVVTLHEILPEVRQEAVQNAYEALKPGGHLLVLDFPYPSKIEDFRNPIYDYGILDQCYEMCIGTEHLSTPEQDALLGKAGFINLQRMPIGKGMFDFVTATK